MAENSRIGWTDHTFNGWMGCTAISPACDHCYAEALMDHRYHKVEWGAGKPRVRTGVSNWNLPLRWNRQAGKFWALHGRRQRVFSASLGDWLDNEVPIDWLIDLLELVRSTPNIDWLLLSKRIGIWRARLNDALFTLQQTPGARREELEAWIGGWLGGKPPHNVWIGATIVNQTEADRDVPKLLSVPAVVRFVSVEPMLAPVSLSEIQPRGDERIWIDALRGQSIGTAGTGDEPELGPRIGWVIIGGESGAEPRPMHVEWVENLLNECKKAGTPAFFKQWGEWIPTHQLPLPERDNVLQATDAFWLRYDGTMHSSDDHEQHEANDCLVVKIGVDKAGNRFDRRLIEQHPMGHAALIVEVEPRPTPRGTIFPGVAA